MMDNPVAFPWLLFQVVGVELFPHLHCLAIRKLSSLRTGAMVLVLCPWVHPGNSCLDFYLGKLSTYLLYVLK